MSTDFIRLKPTTTPLPQDRCHVGDKMLICPDDGAGWEIPCQRKAWPTKAWDTYRDVPFKDPCPSRFTRALDWRVSHLSRIILCYKITAEFAGPKRRVVYQYDTKDNHNRYQLIESLDELESALYRFFDEMGAQRFCFTKEFEDGLLWGLVPHFKMLAIYDDHSYDAKSGELIDLLKFFGVNIKELIESRRVRLARRV